MQQNKTWGGKSISNEGQEPGEKWGGSKGGGHPPQKKLSGEMKG